MPSTVTRSISGKLSLMLMLLKQNILMYTKVFFKQFLLKKKGVLYFHFWAYRGQRVHQSLNTSRVTEILFTDHFYQWLARICLWWVRTEVNQKNGLCEPQDGQSSDILEDAPQRDKQGIEKKSQHMNEAQVWEATEKRWLKLKYSLPANGLNYFSYLTPLKIIY